MSDWQNLSIPTEAIRVVADLTVELTKLRQNEGKYLAIENFAPDLFEQLMRGLLALYYGAGE